MREIQYLCLTNPIAPEWVTLEHAATRKRARRRVGELIETNKETHLLFRERKVSVAVAFKHVLTPHHRAAA